MAQRAQVIDITKSYLPGDPNAYVQSLVNTDREDGEEKTLPVLPYEGINFLPTAYGQKSYFGTNSTLTIANAAIDMLKQLHKGNEHLKFKKAGVIVTGLTDENKKQFQLFDEENPKHLALMKTIDRLNNKVGANKVKLGSQNLTLTWNMKQNYLSPKFNTNFNDILEIQCQ